MPLFTSSSTPTITLSPSNTFTSNPLIPCHSSSLLLPAKPISTTTLTCSLTVSPTHIHVYPDPSPQFAQSETQKFKAELSQKLSEGANEFGDELGAVVDVCAQIFNEFLHKEYGGPGTLLVDPFTDMLVALKKRKLPGAALAARASLLWAQNCLDQDWEVWNSKLK
ncbi:hypothetical protein RJT34_01945 [Clitoria ternatea]|uniref:Uncharacterized protein n=1 Tax=Clitoria ternatea TaxID=43366 RepID=A0AAN9Q3L7_CLITE